MAQALLEYVAAGLRAFHEHLFDFILSRVSLPARSSDVGSQSVFHLNREAINTEEFFLTSDGRRVGFARFGAESGPTVFYLHGYPGCRLSGVFFVESAKKLGARIVAVERPGIGISSPQPSRTILDHPDDIRQLAEHLNIKSYGIIGISGGGPYALACAYALPEENLKSVSIVCGMGPIDVGTKGMSWSNYLTFQGLLHFPAIVRWLGNRAITALEKLPNEKIIEVAARHYAKPSSRWFSNSKDVDILKDPEFLEMVLIFNREHYKQGVEGFMEDGRVLTSDFGFRLQDIRPSLPIQLWYSRADTNVPLRMGEAIADRLSSRPDFHILEDETHMSLVLNYSHDALERLLEKM